LSQSIKHIGLQTGAGVRPRNSRHTNSIRSARCAAVWNTPVLSSAPYNMQLRHRWERRGIAVQIHTLRAEGSRRSTPRPGQSTPGKETQYPIAREAGWFTVSMWRGTKNLARNRVRTPVGTPVLVFIYCQYSYCTGTIKTYPYY
jgi:hypothetical protein